MAGPSAELAILGAVPAFDQPVVVGRPNIGNRGDLWRRLEGALDAGWLSNNGQLVRELEARISDYLNVEHCIAVNNGTVGLEIGLRALEVEGEVVVPAFTFVASAHAPSWLGLDVVLCDVTRATHNVDPAQVERLITDRTGAVMGVHLWGRPCEVERLEALCRERGVKLVFDAAHAFACSHGGEMIGGFGDLEVFSFHATKFFNSFEGGAVVTRDAEVAARVRAMTNFGMGQPGQVGMLGTNGKMSEAAGAMGLTSLDAIDDFIDANRRNYHAVQEALAGVPGLTVCAYDENEKCNYQYLVVEVEAETTGLTADQLVTVLSHENVHAKRYFAPGLHRVPPYRDGAPALPVTEALADRTLLLPSGASVSPEDAGTISALLRRAVEHASDVRRALAEQ